MGKSLTSEFSVSEFKSHPYYFLHNFGQIIYPPWASVSAYAKVLSTTQDLGEIKCRLILAPNIRVIFNRYVTVNLPFIQQHLLQETKDMLPLSTYKVLSIYTYTFVWSSQQPSDYYLNCTDDKATVDSWCDLSKAMQLFYHSSAMILRICQDGKQV